MSTSIEAGRELDAAVAETIMGLRIYRSGASSDRNEPYVDRRSAGELGFPTDPVLFYSTDIAAAWEVVEKADECELWNHTGKAWGCRLTFGHRDGTAAGCPTAPLAICRAALACVSPSAENRVAPTQDKTD